VAGRPELPKLGYTRMQRWLTPGVLRADLPSRSSRCDALFAGFKGPMNEILPLAARSGSLCTGIPYPDAGGGRGIAN
jgi:hypothetical protein